MSTEKQEIKKYRIYRDEEHPDRLIVWVFDERNKGDVCNELFEQGYNIFQFIDDNKYIKVWKRQETKKED